MAKMEIAVKKYVVERVRSKVMQSSGTTCSSARRAWIRHAGRATRRRAALLGYVAISAFVCQRSFFTLAMHLRALTNVPLLHKALFRSVRFLQFSLVASNRQHDRGDPLRSSGCARKAAISASSVNSPTAIRRLPPNQSNPNVLCIALNRTRREAADCLFAESGVGHSEMVAVGSLRQAWRPGVLRLSAGVVRPSPRVGFLVERDRFRVRSVELPPPGARAESASLTSAAGSWRRRASPTLRPPLARFVFVEFPPRFRLDWLRVLGGPSGISPSRRRRP